ncbi:MAG: GTPase CgtA [Clostridiales bacterium]|nr:MAG: GTPase CgtA [Clostridiales bacterium]
MFVDMAKIWIRGGKGGDGAVAFHREKYVNAGGPDGGDGGKGGNIVFQADRNLNTLMDFRYKRKYVAQDGQNGGTNKCTGASAPDLIIKVPFGTLLKDAETGLLIKDLSDDTPFIAAKGGNGGWGNQHFATPTRQIPRFARPGQPGEEFHIQLELKLIADVGLIGFPNVGKSTFLSVISSARPKIANYHFTTMTPNLGVVDYYGNGYVVADIPGIIEGAAEGAGLGTAFLRHVERCRMLLHLVDVAGTEGRDPIADFEAINQELYHYSPVLAALPQIVVANKCDAVSDERAKTAFIEHVEKLGYPVFCISAITKEGVDPLLAKVGGLLEELPKVRIFESEYQKPEPENAKDKSFTVNKVNGVFVIEGEWLSKILATIHFDDYESMNFFQRVLQSNGIVDKLEEMGIKEGDPVRIDDLEFDYIP